MNKEILTEKTFAETIAAHGGRAFRVGGCVRDQFMGIIPKDIDFCVVGMVKKNFKEIFPTAKECGKTFPVFLLEIDSVKCEVAFARTERKVEPGYKGFRVSAKPKVTIEEDLFRRDTRINSIAMDCLTGEIIDPYDGVQDIAAKRLRATGSHFSDDPMRALRLAGQSARFAFTIDEETLSLATAVRDELHQEPKERMLMELTKVLALAEEPGIFFKVLMETNLLEITFKELADLSATKFELIIASLNNVAKITTIPKLRFAVLGCVLDAEALVRWNQMMTLPGDWLDAAMKVNKMVTLLTKPNPEEIVAMINELRRGSLSIEEFDTIAKYAGLSIPLLSPFKLAISSTPTAIPKTLQGKEIGEWLRKQHVEIISRLL